MKKYNNYVVPLQSFQFRAKECMLTDRAFLQKNISRYAKFPMTFLDIYPKKRDFLPEFLSDDSFKYNLKNVNFQAEFLTSESFSTKTISV